MMNSNTLANLITNELVPKSSTAQQRAVALDSWIKICGVLIPYIQANMQVTVPSITSVVSGASPSGAVTGTAYSSPLTFTGGIQ